MSTTKHVQHKTCLLQNMHTTKIVCRKKCLQENINITNHVFYKTCLSQNKSTIMPEIKISQTTFCKTPWLKLLFEYILITWLNILININIYVYIWVCVTVWGGVCKIKNLEVIKVIKFKNRRKVEHALFDLLFPVKKKNTLSGN